ncbi:MT-A70 family methyltransferase [Microvirga massiliensis]|uniref:MT-A70 family methyltransferase n=1 Tax=Microvirga massiliensis TaxID=1033741 RepID=UPI00062BCFF1|nr:MT-A70 family methyltransferase [Microvirga massiliensis]
MRGLFAPLEAWQFGDLRPHYYSLVVADPPWRFRTRSERGGEKSASKHYRCYPVEEIFWRFPIGDLADPDCLLLCWATAPLLDKQIECVKAWGYEYKTLLYWEKIFLSGRPAIGTGYRVRSMAEPVIVATRGEPKHAALPGLFKGIRRKHSQKPESFYEMVDERCTQLTRRADVFARTRRPGWHSFGDELDMFEAAA